MLMKMEQKRKGYPKQHLDLLDVCFGYPFLDWVNNCYHSSLPIRFIKPASSLYPNFL